MDDASALCVGCFRTLDEIIQWTAADDAARAAILAAVLRRRSEHFGQPALLPGASGD